jgi:hypothetical protein
MRRAHEQRFMAGKHIQERLCAAFLSKAYE